MCLWTRHATTILRSRFVIPKPSAAEESSMAPQPALSGGAQALGDIQVALLVCELVRGQAVVILGIRIGAVFQQQLHHGMIAVLGGCVQGSPALLLAGIDGSAMFQKSARDGE